MSLTLPKENPCDTPRAGREIEVHTQVQSRLHCAQLLYHLLYTIVSLLFIGWKPILLHPASAMFQVHPPLLIPCS